MKPDPKHVELMAPAGCFPSLQAAIDGRADSVYFGLSQLNMRARARRSFDIDDLPQLIERCHSAGVKAYLTLNTLMYDHDMPLMNRILDRAKAEQIDAVIVADLAALTATRERGLNAHISTQLSISNYKALAFFAPFSDRVVLARELNLRLIRKIYDQIIENDLRGPSGHLMEIEAFAHGALCIATSGRCGMSLFTSNASANRGACEQNCRHEYEVKSLQTGKVLKIENNLIMSPSDLATVNFLDKLVDSGISTLKIEGRGRSPEYVSRVVSVYREALDALVDGSYSERSADDWMDSLKTVYNRDLASGYYLGQEQRWAPGPSSQATQQKIGIGVVDNYFSKAQVAVIKAETSGLTEGDTYLVIGDRTGVVEGIATGLLVEKEPTQTIERGQLFTLKTPKPVRRGDRLYRMVTRNANPA